MTMHNFGQIICHDICANIFMIIINIFFLFGSSINFNKVRNKFITFYVYSLVIKLGITEIQAVSGTNVNIPCNISNWADDQVSLVLWFRGDTGVPIYRVDARDVPMAKSQHTSAAELGGRFRFDISQKPPVLRIEPVWPTDAAEYRCRVDFRQSRTQNVLASLNVTGEFFVMFVIIKVDVIYLLSFSQYRQKKS